MKTLNKLEVQDTLKVGVLPTALTSNLSVLLENEGLFQKRTLGSIINKNENEYLPSFSSSFPDIFNFNTSTTYNNQELNVSLKNQVKNTVFAAPTNLNGTPAFRMLQDSDLSQTSLNNKANTSGYYSGLSVGYADNSNLWNGESYVSTGNTNITRVMTYNGTSNRWEFSDASGFSNWLGINTAWNLQQVTNNGPSTTLPITANGLTIGNTGGIGYYKGIASDVPLVGFTNTAQDTAIPILSGGLLVSNDFADYGLIPVNGIYSKGTISTTSHGTSADWNAKVSQSQLGNYVIKSGDTMSGNLFTPQLTTKISPLGAGVVSSNAGVKLWTGNGNSQYGISANDPSGGLDIMANQNTYGEIRFWGGTDNNNPTLLATFGLNYAVFKKNIIIPNATAPNHAVAFGQLSAYFQFPSGGNSGQYLNGLGQLVTFPTSFDSIFAYSTQGGLYTTNWNSFALGNKSISIGFGAVANTTNSIVIGSTSFVGGFGSVNVGYSSAIKGSLSSNLGHYNNSNALMSNMVGLGLETSVEGLTVIGRYNKPLPSIDFNTSTPHLQPVFLIGKGRDETERSNAITVFGDGRADYESNYNTANWKPETLVTKKYVDDAVAGNSGNSGNSGYKAIVLDTNATSANLVPSFANSYNHITCNFFGTSNVNMSMSASGYTTDGLILEIVAPTTQYRASQMRWYTDPTNIILGLPLTKGYSKFKYSVLRGAWLKVI